MEYHTQAILKLCRVCGGSLSRSGRVTHSCLQRKADLEKAFDIHIDCDMEDTHPKLFCNSCYAKMKNKIKAIDSKKPHLQALTVFSWNTHNERKCQVCEQFNLISKGGRPSKARKNRGKPTGDSCHDVMQYVIDIAPPTFYDGQPTFDVSPLPLNIKSSDVYCVVCLDVLNSPLQLTACSSLICTSCLIKWIELSKGTKCPVCHHTHLLTLPEINPLEGIHLRLISSLLVTCDLCRQSLHLSEIKSHPEVCGTPSTGCSVTSHELTAEDILTQPITSPPSKIEQEVASKLVKRMMCDGKLTIHVTRGKVSYKLQHSTIILTNLFLY